MLAITEQTTATLFEIRTDFISTITYLKRFYFTVHANLITIKYTCAHIYIYTESVFIYFNNNDNFLYNMIITLYRWGYVIYWAVYLYLMVQPVLSNLINPFLNLKILLYQNFLDFFFFCPIS